MPVMGGCLTVIYATIAMGGIAMLTEVSEKDLAAVKSGEKILNAGEIEEEEKRVAATPCLRNGGTRISTLKAAEVYIFCIPEPGRSVSDVSWYW